MFRRHCDNHLPVPRLFDHKHGIRQVNVEVVEAAKAFGSPNADLIKVQIPQALRQL
jgi:ABC-type proline/glycine betaine transport system permease subunit